jgi:DNA-binding response OmpR family regulator
MVASAAGKLLCRAVPDILVASDVTSIHDEIRSVLEGGEVTVRGVRAGAEVLPAVHVHIPDLLVLDLQIGNMGGMATCLDLRLEEGAGRVARQVPVLMLLDRRPDVFLARRAGAEGWVVKPLDPIRLRRAARALLNGERYEDDSYQPDPVVVTASSDTMPGHGK